MPYLRACTLVLGLLLTTLNGCGGGTSESVIESRQAAQQALDQAAQSIGNKDYSAAKPLLDQAIESKLLNIDVLCKATVLRAVCLAEAGDFAAANADLDEMEQGAPNMDEVFAARSFVLEKQGKTSEANAAWAKARRLNRFVRKFGT